MKKIIQLIKEIVVDSIGTQVAATIAVAGTIAGIVYVSKNAPVVQTNDSVNNNKVVKERPAQRPEVNSKQTKQVTNNQVKKPQTVSDNNSSSNFSESTTFAQSDNQPSENIDRGQAPIIENDNSVNSKELKIDKKNNNNDDVNFKNNTNNDNFLKRRPRKKRPPVSGRSSNRGNKLKGANKTSTATSSTGGGGGVSTKPKPAPINITITKEASQVDIINILPIKFTFSFEEKIVASTFVASDIVQNGTASGVVWSITDDGDGKTFTVAATASSDGTLIPSLKTGAIVALSGGINKKPIETANLVTYNTSSTTVVINQKSTQVDPINALPIEFEIAFSGVIDPTTFDASDITQNGTATGITWSVTNSGDNKNFTLRATAISTNGTVIPSLNSAVIKDIAGNDNIASTSSDNSVVYDTGSVAVTINQASGQSDPVNSLDIIFDVAFSETITTASFTTADIVQNGTATGVTWSLTNSGDNQNYTLRGTATSSDGTLVPSINAGTVLDSSGNNNTASTATDNSVTYDTTGATVTINEGSSQQDPINTTDVVFDVVFSEAINTGSFTAADITQNGTATGVTWTVTDSGDQTNFTVRATAVGVDGTLRPSIAAGVTTDPAGNTSSVSTSTDNTVTFERVKPSVTINERSSQSDPINSLPVEFDVVFSEPIKASSFVPGDISESGDAASITWTITDSGDQTNFILRATVVGDDGYIVPSIAAGAVEDPANNTNTVSTATDNSVNYDITAPGITTIAGVTGGSDSTQDVHLTSGLIPTIHWSDVTGEESYDVTIYESDGSTIKCATVNKAANSTSHSFSSCTLTKGKAYQVKVIAKDNFNNIAASNDMLEFLVDPTISIAADVTVAENVGAGVLAFTIQLDAASDWATSIDYATADGTALVAGTFLDYTATNGTLNITAGNTSGTVNVPINDDSYDEPDTQTFTLTISNPTNAQLGTATRNGNITDDDAPPTITVADATGPEATDITFTATLSLVSEKVINFSWTSTDNVAVNATDYTGGTGGPLTIPIDTATYDFTVSPIDNSTVCQVPRDFNITLDTFVNVTAGTDIVGLGTIEEDDFPYATFSSATAIEGGNFNIDITLDQTCANYDVSANWQVSSGSAIVGSDLPATTGTFIVTSGSLDSTISVPTTDDTNVETSEEFSIQIVSSSTLDIDNSISGIYTIQDNDSSTEDSVVKVAVGMNHACALISNGKVKCWGSKENGRLGIPFHPGYAQDSMGDNLEVNRMLPSGKTPMYISGHDNAYCILTTDGEAYCAGQGSYSSLLNTPGDPYYLKTIFGGGIQTEKLALGTDSTVKKLELKDDNGCAVFNNGGVKCWGRYFGILDYREGWDDDNVLGDSVHEREDKLPYIDLGTGVTAKDVILGDRRACAHLSDDTVKCWGGDGNSALGLGYGNVLVLGNHENELGDNLPTLDFGVDGSSTPYTVKQIQMEHQTACAILHDNNMKCWMKGTYGQTGQGNEDIIGDDPGELASTPVIDLGTGRTAKDMAVGGGSVCAILDNDLVKCWGYNPHGQLGQGHTNHRGDDGGEMGDNLPYTDLGTGRTAKDIQYVYSGYCAHLDDDTMKCWGYDGGRSGHAAGVNAQSIGDDAGEMGDNLAAFDLGTGRSVLKLSHSMPRFNCVILDNNSVKCWGNPGDYTSAYGVDMRIGASPSELGSNLAYVDLGTDLKVSDISIGAFHSCVLFENGQIKCWGDGDHGALGSGAETNIPSDINQMGTNLSFVSLPTGRKAIKVSAGERFTCAILDNNDTVCWGLNTSGQLGIGSTSLIGNGAGEMGDNLVAVDLGTNKYAIDISAGNTHACAVLNDNSLKCWGSGYRGKLGSGSGATIGNEAGEMGDNLPAVNLGTNQKAKQVIAHSNFTCAVLLDGKMKCFGDVRYRFFGDNLSGSNYGIGDDPTEMGDNLLPVNWGTGLKVASAGKGINTNLCVLFENGKVKCMGTYEEYNGLGNNYDGNTEAEIGDSLPYVDVGSGRSVIYIANGYQKTCVILDNGDVKCWGRDYGDDILVADHTTYSSLNRYIRVGDQLNEMGDNLAPIPLVGDPSPIGGFVISGVQGGTDTTNDSWLGNTEATVSWTSATTATQYKVIIYEDDGTTVKCAEATTAATSYAFTGCNLTDGTLYRLKVVAEDGSSNSRVASNSLFDFTVNLSAPAAFTIAGVTGGLDTTEDATLADGLLPTFHWDTGANVSQYQITVYQSDGTTVQCAQQSIVAGTDNYYFSSCNLSDSTSYEVKVVAVAPSGLTTEATNSQFAFSVSDSTGPDAFDITGVTGGSDSTVDTELTAGSWATINWNDTAGENSYDITIYESDGSTIACATQNSGLDTSSYNFNGCDLTDGNTYITRVIAKDTFTTTEATNSPFTFTLNVTGTGSFDILGIQGGTDTTSDASLASGNSPHIYWQAASNADHYDISIEDASGAVHCSKTDVSATDYDMSSCFLNGGETYYLNVTAVDASSNSLAADNSPYTFDVSTYPTATIADVSVTEGDNAVFTVTLSNTWPEDVSLHYKTTPLRSTPNSDFAMTEGTVTITSGNTTGTITIATTEDTNAEASELFIVSLANPVNAITDSENSIAIATITDDDTGPHVSKIAAHSDVTCFLTSEGKVKCVGNRKDGRLFQPDNPVGWSSSEMGDNLPALDVGTGVTVSDVATSQYGTCVVTGTGGLRCFGQDWYTLGYDAPNHVGDQSNEMGDNLSDITVGATVEKVVAGYENYCLLTTDGRVKCWGEGDQGVNGQNNADDEYLSGVSFIDFGTGHTVKDIFMGGNHVCAILDDDSAKCWGNAGYGKLGNNSGASRGNDPSEMGDNLPYTKLGSYGTCDLGQYYRNQTDCEDGVLTGWCSNDYAATTSSECGGTWTISAGSCSLGWHWHTQSECVSEGGTWTSAIGECDNTIYNNQTDCESNAGTWTITYGMACDDPAYDNETDCESNSAAWSFDQGTCSNGTYLTKTDCVAASETWTANLGSCSDITYTDRATCEINTETWTPNTAYGNWSTQNYTAKSFALGDNSTCVLLNTDEVKCFGSDRDSGQLGRTTGYSDRDMGNESGEMEELRPLYFGKGLTVKKMTTSGGSYCAIVSNDRLKCWGYDSDTGLFLAGAGRREVGDSGAMEVSTFNFRNLGNDSTDNDHLVLNIQGMNEGYCALLNENKVKCWGVNNWGQLGYGGVPYLGNIDYSWGDNIPYVDLGTGLYPTKFANTAANSEHMCAILNDGSTKCWGRHHEGRLGNGEGGFLGDEPGEIGSNLPYADFPTGTSIVDIAVGGRASCAIASDGKMYCSGYDYRGMIPGDHNGRYPNNYGDDFLATDSDPTLNILKVSLGSEHGCALYDNFTVKCWGQAYSGYGERLGYEKDNSDIGTLSSETPPIDLGHGRKAIDISVGHGHSCALLDNYKVKCWGDGGHGRLGSNNTVDRGDESGEMGNNLPYVLLGSRTAFQVDAGRAYTCVLLDTQEIKCFGYNYAGALGNGTPHQTIIGDEAGEMESLAKVDIGTRKGLYLESSSSDYVTCALIDNAGKSESLCWGEDDYGSLGDENTANDNIGDSAGETTSAVIDLGTAKVPDQIVTGGPQTCALLTDASVKCWGYQDARIGHGTYDPTDQIGEDPGEMGDALSPIDLGL